ncbi:superoxide dismutase [Alteribacillus bidgolensis]|uniref:superoxide dismutase n=1 Tax=Alteribacillus bidgolensis TaxID=930129 RepID=A0A1G8PMR1_9BACI|nr:superoxide dismutase [Alteribacillus bidgolensis]SDI93821.1 superoxide dismutase, Fe-Mn family [Alteribacillus bidgolensis]
MSEVENLLNDMDRRAVHLIEEWNKACHHKQLPICEETTQYSDQLDDFVNQLEQIKKNRNVFNNGMAHQLEQMASSLTEQWKRLFSLRETNETRDNSPVPIGGHTLPPLPYSYEALEPYIDRRIMRLHHDKHHQSYVDGLNKAEKEMEKARRTNDYSLIKHWEREAAFNGAGHYLHTIFWNVMSPQGGGKPKGALLSEIDRWFGSFNQFKRHFSEAAKNVEAVGWAILVWAPRSNRLEILQAEKHQNLSQWDVIPLLVLDVWEHAFYLQYENNRGKYVDNWWNVVNWDEVEKRYNEAKKVKWKPF